MGFMPIAQLAQKFFSAELTQAHNHTRIYLEPTCNRNKPWKRGIFFAAGPCLGYQLLPPQLH